VAFGRGGDSGRYEGGRRRQSPPWGPSPAAAEIKVATSFDGGGGVVDWDREGGLLFIESRWRRGAGEGRMHERLERN